MRHAKTRNMRSAVLPGSVVLRQLVSLMWMLDSVFDAFWFCKGVSFDVGPEAVGLVRVFRMLVGSQLERLWVLHSARFLEALLELLEVWVFEFALQAL